MAKRFITNQKAHGVIVVSTLVLIASVFANVYFHQKAATEREPLVRENFCDQNMCGLPPT